MPIRTPVGPTTTPGTPRPQEPARPAQPAAPAAAPATTSPASPSAPGAEPKAADLTQSEVAELLQKAQGGQLTPAEAKLVRELNDTPELKDQFTPQQRADLDGFVRGKEPPLRAPKELSSDLSKLTKAKEVPERLTADALLLRGQLVDRQGLSREAKATRLVQFLLPYAQTAAELSRTPKELSDATAKLLKAAEKLGYGDIERQPDGRPVLQLLKEAMTAKAPSEVVRQLGSQSFDAPNAAKDAGALAAAEQSQSAQPHLEPFRPPPQVLQTPTPVKEPAERPEGIEGEGALDDGGRRGRLGPRMLWNVLHQFRDDGAAEDKESAAQREENNRIALIAGLVLTFMAIVIGILVAL